MPHAPLWPAVWPITLTNCIVSGASCWDFEVNYFNKILTEELYGIGCRNSRTFQYGTVIPALTKTSQRAASGLGALSRRATADLRRLAYGKNWKEQPVKKAWSILTTNRSLWLTLNKKRDGSHEHVHCRGQVAQASSFYPPRMCKDILKAMKYDWTQQSNSLEKMVGHYMLEIDNQMKRLAILDIINIVIYCHHLQQALAEHQEQALALSRSKLQLETAPAGKKLEAVKQLPSSSSQWTFWDVKSGGAS